MALSAQDIKAAGCAPRVAVVLGSGLAGVVDVEPAFSCSYAEIEGAPTPLAAAPGHAGRLVLGRTGGLPVAVFEGRIHLYQGVGAREAAWPADMAADLGAEILIALNASGSLRDTLEPGTVGAVADHLSLFMPSPLAGSGGANGEMSFMPTADAYDAELRRLAIGVAAGFDQALPEVVYAAVPGPQYESAAEVRALESLGAEVVGMSTVPEVLVARARGLRVLALTYVANMAGATDLSHAEVLAAGERGRGTIAALVAGILAGLSTA